MLTAVFLSALLMLGGLGGAAASHLQVYGKSINSDKTLLSSNDGGHTVKKQSHQQSEIRRSLDLESYRVPVTPRTNKIGLPSGIKLYPSTAKPLHLHGMPMHFGRESVPGDDKSPNSPPNMPQRFGRSWGVIQLFAEGPKVREAQNPVLLQRFGRSSRYMRLLRTLVNEKLLNTGLHWAKDFDFTTSSEEVEVQEKSFRGFKRPRQRSSM